MSVVKGLCRKYEDFEINIPEWEIGDQGITALCGPSGSGKTSVFRLMIGLEPCSGLEWTFDGLDLAKIPVPDRRLGIVFQSLELFPHMTAEENILFAARSRGLHESESRPRLNELVSDLQLQSCLQRKAAVLSGGEAQRVALARAVIARPRFLFLDEPFSALDSEIRDEARSVVRRVIQRLAIPTLLITHDAEDLRALAQTVVNIRDGKLVKV